MVLPEVPLFYEEILFGIATLTINTFVHLTLAISRARCDRRLHSIFKRC